MKNGKLNLFSLRATGRLREGLELALFAAQDLILQLKRHPKLLRLAKKNLKSAPIPTSPSPFA